MAVLQVPSKSAFTRDVLTKNNQASFKAVNEAWKEAGHEGSISDALVKQVRSEMKLTRNARLGPKAAGGDASAQKTTGAPPLTKSVVAKRPVGRPPKANGKHEPALTATGPKPKLTSGNRSGSLTKLEGKIDDMIFEIKSAGGFPEFEETLRKARRILARSHEE